jgi:hypothetical protein
MPVVQLEQINAVEKFDAGTDGSGNPKEIEIVAFGDNTISMREHVDGEGGDGPLKAQVLIDVLAEMAIELWQLDSQAAREAAAGADAGGIRVIRWGRQWFDDGDWRPANVEEKARLFKFDETGTYIMQGVSGVKKVYHDEFAVDEHGQPTPVEDRPALLLAGVTDGWCFDNADFEKFCSSLGGDIFLVLVVIGSGNEYRQAVQGYAKIAESNPHFVLIPMGTHPNVVKVKDAFLKLAGAYE